MGMRPTEIRSSALGLPPEERAALAHDLIESLDADDANPRADELWAAEILRRGQEVLDGKVDLVDSDTVHAEITRQLRSSGGR